jgi:hypothetical protein
VCLLFTMFICTLSLIGLGQVRLLVAHCYPFFLVGISIAMLEVFKGDARRILHAVGISLLALVTLYLGYLAYRGLDSLTLAVLPVLLCGLMFRKLWRLA